MSLVLGGLICAVWSLIFPEDYDFQSMRKIKMIDSEDTGEDHFGFSKVLTHLSVLHATLNFLKKLEEYLCLEMKNHQFSGLSRRPLLKEAGLEKSTPLPIWYCSNSETFKQCCRRV